MPRPESLVRVTRVGPCLAGGAVLALLAAQAGCTAMLLGGAPGVPAGTSSPSSLASTVSARIGADPALAGQIISVSGQGAVITLRGRVASAAQRADAEALARSVSGVSDVDNRLVVQSGS